MLTGQQKTFSSVAAVLCLGAFLWGVAWVFRAEGAWKQVDSRTVAGFQVVVFDRGTPLVVDIMEVPEGSTFFVPPEREASVKAELLERFDSSLKIQKRSTTRGSHELILDRNVDGAVEKYFYWASDHQVTPIGWSRLDSSVFGPALAHGAICSLIAFVCWTLIFALSAGRKRPTSKPYQQSTKTELES